MLEWYKRCKRDETQMAERRTWRTKCGHYQVVESNIKYGRKHDRHGNFLGYPIVYLAMVLKDTGWEIISRHRKRGAAVKQLEHYHETGRPLPKNTKANKAKKKMREKRKQKLDKAE